MSLNLKKQELLHLILMSIGIKQLSLSHLINNEAEEIDHAINKNLTIEELLGMNKQIKRILKAARNKEILLQIKQFDIIDYLTEK